MKHSSSILLLTAAVLLAIPASQAAIIVTANPVTVLHGDLSGYFDVTFTNTVGSEDTWVDAFSFSLFVADPGITFTRADMSTALPYIFEGDSFAAEFGLDRIEITLPGQTLTAADLSNSGAGTLARGGSTFGLGRVYFDIGAGAGPHTAVIIRPRPDTSLSDLEGNEIPIATVDGSIDILPAPEPATLLPVGLAAILLIVLRRRQAPDVRLRFRLR